MTIIDRRGKIIPLWEKAGKGKGLYIFLKVVLIFCSYLFGLGLAIRRFVYGCGLKKKTRLKARVISVGNITLGGTGKTPLAEYIARKAKRDNKRVAILSRGYGAGDEALLFSKRNKDIPILVGKNRRETGREAVRKLDAELIILDDGFQHRPLERDLDVVALDSTSSIWENRLLPAGTLREGLNSLKRAQVFVLTRVDNNTEVRFWSEYLKRINPQAPIFLACHKPKGFINKYGESFSLSLIKDKDTVAFSGIAKPEAFEKTLKELGARLIYSFRYPDHHLYTVEDLKEIRDIAPEDASIIATEKDLVRIESDILGKRLLALAIELEFLRDENEFGAKIFS